MDLLFFQLYVIFPACRYFSFEFASDLLFRTQSCFRLSLSLPYVNKVFVEVQLGYSSSEQGYPSFSETACPQKCPSLTFNEWNHFHWDEGVDISSVFLRKQHNINRALEGLSFPQKCDNKGLGWGSVPGCTCCYLDRPACLRLFMHNPLSVFKVCL